MAPAEVVTYLRREHLVETTVTRLQAYRRYREQAGDYWTKEKLEEQHCDWLYDQVPEDRAVFGDRAHKNTESRDKALMPINEAFKGVTNTGDELRNEYEGFRMQVEETERDKDCI